MLNYYALWNGSLNDGEGPYSTIVYYVERFNRDVNRHENDRGNDEDQSGSRAVERATSSPSPLSPCLAR